MKSISEILTFGSDPEFMVSVDGQITSAIPFFEFNKEESAIPVKLEDGLTLYPDNVNLEFSMPYGLTTEQSVDNFRKLAQKGNDFLKKNNARLIARASHYFNNKDIEHFHAKRVGCSVEYCAYDMAPCDPPDLKNMTFRSAGGHIHVGRNDYKTTTETFLLNFESKMAGVRAMDWFVGTALALMDNDPSAPERKRLYGKSGRHRGENLRYGFEYRTPSNYWVSRPELVSFVDRLTRFTMEECIKNMESFLDDSRDLGVVRLIIDSDDKNEAKSFIKKNFPEKIANEIFDLAALPYNGDMAVNYAI